MAKFRKKKMAMLFNLFPDQERISALILIIIECNNYIYIYFLIKIL